MRQSYQFNSLVLLLLLVVGICFSLPRPLAAQSQASAPAHNPQPCASIYTDSNTKEIHWGIPFQDLCPANMAVIGSSIPKASGGRTTEQIRIDINCCPLPADDILLDEHIEVFDKCPENFIATGAQRGCGWEKPPGPPFLCPKKIRCTKINLSRYQLGPAKIAAHWGFSATSWRNSQRVFKSEIPKAIRNALSRTSRYSWETQGCVGYPYGSLLVEKYAKRCQGLFFRQLQFRGINQDPKKGTAVVMFPQCENVSGIFDKHLECE